MRRCFVFLIVLLTAQAGCYGQEVGGVVQAFADEHLGHGYELKWRHVDLSDCKNCFEKTGHYTDLYWHSKRIGVQVGRPFISPSGEYALFEVPGKLVLFVRSSRSTRDVTDGDFAIPKEVKWDEKSQRAVVAYYEKHGPSTIKLPERTK